MNSLREKLKGCMLEGDIIKALAIIDYTIGNTDIIAEDLIILNQEDPNSILNIASNKGYDDFAFTLIGFCKTLHFIESDN